MRICYRYFEDSSSLALLTQCQCSIPCFGGLFLDIHNKPISVLLYVILTWHGLAKLRLHTELTLTLLRSATVRLGRELRSFQKNICPHYETKETAKEVEIRARAAARREGAALASSNTQQLPTTTLEALPEDHSAAQTTPVNARKGPAARKPFQFKLTKPKCHFIGDYAPDIESSGTTDNYSTQTVRIIYCERTVSHYFLPGRTRASTSQVSLSSHIQSGRDRSIGQARRIR